MAIWQFDFLIIPNKNTNIINEEITLWKKIDINLEALYNISKYLGTKKSWSNKIDLFGNPDSTCIEIYNYDNDTLEIICRLDLRYISKEMFEKIFDFITILGSNIYYNNIVYFIDERLLAELIMQSQNAKFCANPLSFLEKLKGNSN